MAFTGTLRDFQLDGYEMAVDRNCVLGYDKGLGKTVITTAAMETLFEDGDVRSGFVVCPASLKYQWQRKMREFTDGATSILAVGDTPKQREQAYQRYDDGEIDMLILSYNNVVDDWKHVERMPRDAVVLDEATYVKGFSSQRSKRIKNMRAKVRLALTASPIENRPEEIYSIMQYVDKRALGSPEYFDRAFIKRDSYGGVQYYRNLPQLHERLKDFVSRKTWFDDDVKDEMPNIHEEVITVPWDRTGARLYNRIRKELLADLAEASGQSFDVMAYYSGADADGGNNKLRGQIMQKLTALRMLCDHPTLLRLSGDKFVEWDEERRTKVQQGSRYAAGLDQDGLLRGLYEMPKMDRVIEDILQVLEENKTNKIVVFSYFKPTVHMFHEIMRDEFDLRSVVYHGDMTPKQKDAAAVLFAEDPDVRLFFATDAGGYGLDIPEANYLFNYDLPWSAGALGQRNGRIMRLSSQFDDIYFRHYLMENSVEIRQYDMLEMKEAIATAILDGKGWDAYGKLNLSLDSLKDFMLDSEVLAA